MTLRILTFPEAATPPALRAQQVALEHEAWPPPDGSDADGPGAGAGHDPALRPLSMLLVDGVTVLAGLAVLRKEIDHAGHRQRVGGLSAVVTSRRARRRGHGLRLVTAARRAMPQQGLDLGLFTCDRELEPFYTRAGWQTLEGAVLVGGTRRDPLPSDRPGFDKVTMADFFSPGARRHRSAYPHSRIALHPGGIDRLW